MADVADLEVRSTITGDDAVVTGLGRVAKAGKAAEQSAEGYSAAMKKAARDAEKAADDQAKAAAKAARAHEANLERAASAQQRVMRATQRAGLDLTRQFSDIGVSIAGGMPIWMVLTQQLPQISDGLTVAKQSGVNFRQALVSMLSGISPVVVALGALAVALGALAALWLKGESDALAFEKSVTGLGRVSGISAQQLKALADTNASAGDVSLGAARKMAIAYNNTGAVGTEVMGRLIRITKDYGSVMGIDATEATEALGDAMKSPDEAGRDLTRTIGLLTQEQLKQIDAAVKAGDQMAAQTILLNALDDAVEGHASKTGLITSAWDAVAQSIGNAITKLGEFLYRTKDEEIAQLQQRLQPGWRGVDMEISFGTSAETPRQRAERRLTELQFQRGYENAAAANAARFAQSNRRAQQIVDNADPARRTRTPRAAGKSDEEREYEALINASQRMVDQLNEEAKTYGMAWEELARFNAAQQVRLLMADDVTQAEVLLAQAIMDGTEAMIARRKLMDGEKLDKADDIRLGDLDVRVPEITGLAELARDALRDIDDAALDLGNSLSQTFGQAGQSLGALISNFTDYRASMAQIAFDVEKNGLSEEKATRQRGILEAKTYADMAGAAKGFFDEKSKGYQILQTVEMAYRGFQMASSVTAMVRDSMETAATVANAGTKAAASTAAGGAKMFEQLGVWAFPVVGAMVAVMAALGMRGGGGSITAPTMPATNTGTGTVLGNGDAESASLQNSLDRAEQYQNKDLDYSNKMVDALRAIQTNIGRVTDAISRQMGLGGGLDSSRLDLGTNTSGGFLGIGATTRTSALAGSGLDLNGGTLAQLIAQGVSGSMYQLIENTKTKSGFLGIGGKTTSWISEDRTAIDGELSRELTRVLTSLRSGVLTAAGELGITGAEATLDALTIELGRIDFNGMTSGEISDRLNAIFSAAGDRMAEAVLPTLAQYQMAGEGMLETMTRLATMMRTVDVTLESIGMEFRVTGIESLEARNRLVELSGGLEAFVDGTASFAENFLTDAQRIAPVQAAVSRELDRLGIAANIGRTEFANLVLGLDVSTEAGATMFAALMRLAPALDQAISYTEELTGTVTDLADLTRQRRDLEIQLMEAQGDAAGALAARRADELEAIDVSLRPLQLLVWARQDLNVAEEAALALAGRQRDLEIRLMEAQGNAAGASAARRQLELVAMDESLRPLLALIFATEDLAAANESAAAAATAEAERLAQIAADRHELTVRLMEAEGNSAGALAARRQDEIDAADESNRAILRAIFAAEDLAVANEAAATAMAAATAAAEAEAERLAQVAAERRDLSIRLMEVTGDSLGALAARREDEIASVDESNRAILRAIFAAEDYASAQAAAAQAQEDATALVEHARNALQQAYDRESSALIETRDKFKAFASAISDFRRTLGTEGLTNAQARAVSREDFERTITQAKLGDEEAFGKLIGVSQSYYDETVKGARTQAEAQRILANIKADLALAEETATRHSTIAEQQLQALNASVSGLIQINSSVLSVVDAIAALQLAQQNLAALPAPLPTLPNTGTQVGPATGSSRNWGIPENHAVNQQLAALTGYMGDFGSGGWHSWITQQSEEIRNTARMTLIMNGQHERIVGFAKGGVFTNGIVTQPTMFNMAQMGESGSEAIVPLAMGPEGLGIRSFGANNDNALVAAIDAVHNELVALRAEVRRDARANEKSAAVLQRVSGGGDVFITEAVS
jgi:hypothetical protein